MKSAIFITVRMDSSRLPNKAMREILGKPILGHVITRAKQTKRFDEIIVCTTQREVDEQIVLLAENYGVKTFQGSLTDKLERWNGAAKQYHVDYIVTFDGDDLFCDPYLLDKGAQQIAENRYDFIELPKGMICGAFTYAFTAKALEKVCEIKATDETEMMWTYFKDTGLFKTGYLEQVEDIYFSDKYRLTLDYPEDLEFFEKVFDHFGCINNDVPLKKIIDYLGDHPEIPQINISRQQEFLDNQKKKTRLLLKSV